MGNRLSSLDILRGLTIAIMILVNFQPDVLDIIFKYCFDIEKVTPRCSIVTIIEEVFYYVSKYQGIIKQCKTNGENR